MRVGWLGHHEDSGGGVLVLLGRRRGAAPTTRAWLGPMGAGGEVGVFTDGVSNPLAHLVVPDVRTPHGKLVLSALLPDRDQVEIVRLAAKGAAAEDAVRGELMILTSELESEKWELPMARLFVTDLNEGRLYLYDVAGQKCTLGPNRGAGSLWLYAHALVEAGRAERRRVIAADGRRTEGGSTSVWRGRIRLYETSAPGETWAPPEEPDPMVSLAVDDRGGYLKLSGRERTMVLDDGGLALGTPPMVVGGGVGGFAPEKMAGGAGLLLGIDGVAADGTGGQGFLELYDEHTIMRIDSSGIHTDGVKFNNFVLDHPDDTTKQIFYAVLEGPEAGVYVRGTAMLSGGAATVCLPAHFSHVASDDGLTAHLTPRSADSRGVSACALTREQITIKELFQGTGSYAVDYLVHGLRSGTEGYEVVRDRLTRRSAPVAERPPRIRSE